MSPYAIGGKMGEVVEIDSKGRIVIPSSIRNKLGLSAGTALVVDIKGDEIVLSQIATEVVNQVKPDDLKDFLSRCSSETPTG